MIRILRNNNEYHTPRRSLALLFLLFGIVLADNLIKPDRVGEGLCHHVFLITRSSYFLVGPFLSFYAGSLMSRARWEWKRVLHFLPYTVLTALRIVFPFLRIPPDSPVLFYGSFPAPGTSRFFIFILDLFSLLSQIGYSFLILKRLVSYGKSIPGFYSKNVLGNPLSRLFYLLVFYGGLLVINGVVLLLIHDLPHILPFFSALTRLAPPVLFMFLFSLSVREQAVPGKKKKESLPPKNSREGKYEKSGMTDGEAKKLYTQLNLFLSEKKSFLNPEMTLEDLAQEMGETRHRLSEAINRESGEKFYNYINRFRLKEFLLCLEENRYPQYTIKAKARECGFKSISAFYDIFKRDLGKTP
ncbi:MAG: helix-turn-helix domain-containing protein, partial [Spirochaetales bacterium]|nr:helix-turn-helix domain-containing protein [Spirochaetales bacterium]